MENHQYNEIIHQLKKINQNLEHLLRHLEKKDGLYIQYNNLQDIRRSVEIDQVPIQGD